MIHVEAKPEPPSFEEKVRHKGIRWLREHNEALASKTTVPPYWRACLADLKDAYAGLCASLPPAL